MWARTDDRDVVAEKRAEAKNAEPRYRDHHNDDECDPHSFHRVGD